MIKNLSKLFVCVTIAFGIACGNNNSNSGFVIGVVPNQPPLIPVGAGETVAGITIAAPYFNVNEMTMQWKGAGGLSILLIEMKSPTQSSTSGSGTTSIDCAISGQQLTALFTTNIFTPGNVNGQIIIPGVGFNLSTGVPVADPTVTTAVIVGTSEIPCTGFSLPSPVPDSFTSPVQIKVTAGIVPDPVNNPANISGLVTATGSITPGY